MHLQVINQDRQTQDLLASNKPGPPDSGFVGVKVVDRLQIKGLDITLLNAQSATDLTGWLNANGYRYPEGAVNVIEHYIAKEWSFVAVKVDTPDEESQSTPSSLWSGYFPRDPPQTDFPNRPICLSDAHFVSK
jgi:hypothetical protein